MVQKAKKVSVFAVAFFRIIAHPFSKQTRDIKGILWQFYKLVLKVASGRDENDGIGHFAELGSCWPGEPKTWPKIGLRVGGRAEKYCVGGRAEL